MSSSIAAAITIIIIGAIFLLNPITSLEAERGQNLEYVFSDKSEVFLNAQSKISFRENRWDKERQINLDGEAYFKVIKGGPFTVKSKVGSVRVLGTEFNIKTHNGIYEVECFEGKVQVLYKDSKIVLEKDDAVYFDKDGKITQRQIPNNESDWLNGRSRFRDERLGMVLSELERQFNVRVTSNTNESVFTGVFDHTDLETAANQIAKPLGLEFVISEDKKSISFSQ